MRRVASVALPVTIHYSTIHYSLFTIHYSLSIIHNSQQLTTHNSLILIAAQSSHKISLVGITITFAGAVFFSTKAIFVKLAFAATTTDALSLLTLRMIFALPFYLVVAFVYGQKKGNVKISRLQWVYVITLGLFGYYFSSLLDFTGLQYISAGLERLILFLYPTFAVLINVFVFKQHISKRQMVALVLTYAGIAYAFYGEVNLKEINPNLYRGSFLVFLCAVTYSIYIAGSGKVIPLVGAAKFTAYAMLAATTGIFMHFTLRGNFQHLNSGSGLWWYGLLLGVVATVLPSFMISYGLKKIGSNNVAIISGIGPVSTIIQAHLILGEKIFFEQLAGTALVVIGVLLIGWKSSRTET
ncbi:MAG: DMT family transporter [Chitinophagaceae bacterium]|nr:DMT family transporter [Chitinophagaceae bacterium]